VSLMKISPFEKGGRGDLTSGGLLLAAILVIAAAARVAALLSLKGTIYFDALLTDERAYHEWALKIADGTYRSSAVYELAPLPAYVMALVYTLFGADVLYVRILNLVLGVASCALVYAVGRELAGRAVGLVACLAAALYQQLVFYSIVPLKESLSVFCTAACAALLLRLLREDRAVPGRPWAAALGAGLLGAIAGLSVNVRGVNAALVPVIAIFAVLGPRGPGRTRVQRALFAAAFAAGLALAVAPVAVRNYRASGQLALSTAQTGRNLYFGDDPDNPTPYYRPARFASSVPGEQAVQFAIEASRRAGRSLDQEESSAFWTREIAARAAAHPAAFLEKLGLKALALLNRFESSDHYHVGFLARFAPFFRLPFLELWLILPLGLAGMIALARRSRGHAALAALAATYAATLVLFAVNARYRLPLVVALIPFAAAGAFHLARAVAERRVGAAVAFAGTAALFGAIEFLPLPGAGDLSGYASTHALLLDGRGEREAAVRMWDEASRMRGAFSPIADLFLAGKAADRGDLREAFRRARSIPDASFAAAAKHALLGDLHQRAGDGRRAAAEYERSLAVNSGQRRIRGELIRLYARSAPEKVAREKRELARVESFFARQ
jgi:4-amino-4-deoxy-L-arabinose transferase-like glycosyltransferase